MNGFSALQHTVLIQKPPCGTTNSGAGKDGETSIVGFADTHHSISLEDCAACHESGDGGKTNIRICERCHDKNTIHNLAPHADEKNCVICHTLSK